MFNLFINRLAPSLSYSAVLAYWPYCKDAKLLPTPTSGRWDYYLLTSISAGRIYFILQHSLDEKSHTLKKFNMCHMFLKIPSAAKIYFLTSYKPFGNKVCECL
jgi:hypothetical protein